MNCWIKLLFCFLCVQNNFEFSCHFIKFRLNHWWQMDYFVGMHRSDTQDRYRLRSGHFLWIGYWSDEDRSKSDVVHILFCAVVRPTRKSHKHHKGTIKFFVHYISSVLQLFHSFNLRYRGIFKSLNSSSRKLLSAAAVCHPPFSIRLLHSNSLQERTVTEV